MALPVNRPLDRVWVSAYMADVGTASSAFAVSPVRGYIKQIRGVAYVAPTTADSTVTAKINGTAITGVSITVPFSGAAAGDRYSTGGVPTSTATSFVNAGDNIEIITNGNSSGVSPVMWSIEIEVQ